MSRNVFTEKIKVSGVQLMKQSLLYLLPCLLVTSALWGSRVRDAPPWLDNLSLVLPSSYKKQFALFFTISVFSRYRPDQKYCWACPCVFSMYSVDCKSNGRGAEPASVKEAMRQRLAETVDGQNEGHMGQHPGVVLESVNCRRTCRSPLNCCIALRESHLWQLPTSEKGIKVAS